MLERLASVDWEQLQHAYGAATDVPFLVRDLASAEATVRTEALGKLYSSIWHQGTVYEATAPAVPFLLELLGDDSTPEREKIVVLLSDLATGASYLEAHQGLEIFKSMYAERMQTEEYQAELRRELSWVKASREAVEQGWPLYAHLLADREIALRASVSFLLGTLRGIADRAIPVIFERLLVEAEAGVRASHILALGALMNDQTAWLEVQQRVFSIETDSGCLAALALSAARILREKTSAGSR